MNEITSLPRRGFLRGLARPPLIGGSVAIIGAPVKAAVPITDQLLSTYEQWLRCEHMMLKNEMYGSSYGDGREWALIGWKYHFPPQADGSPFVGWDSVPEPLQPSARAAAVLSAVGCFEQAAENFEDRRAIANMVGFLHRREDKNG